VFAYDFLVQLHYVMEIDCFFEFYCHNTRNNRSRLTTRVGPHAVSAVGSNQKFSLRSFSKVTEAFANITSVT
jgi:hypothetical protein